MNLIEFKKYIETGNDFDVKEYIEAWKEALRKCNDIQDLSCDIGYGFSDYDIEILAKLHKRNYCRRKIEALLTDCNFHYECGKFYNKEYGMFIRTSEV